MSRKRSGSKINIDAVFRKRTAPSQEPEEWTRTSMDSTGDSVTVFVSIKNWGKSKDIILRVTIELSEVEGLDFK